MGVKCPAIINIVSNDGLHAMPTAATYRSWRSCKNCCPKCYRHFSRFPAFGVLLLGIYSQHYSKEFEVKKVEMAAHGILASSLLTTFILSFCPSLGTAQYLLYQTNVLIENSNLTESIDSEFECGVLCKARGPECLGFNILDDGGTLTCQIPQPRQFYWVMDTGVKSRLFASKEDCEQVCSR